MRDDAAAALSYLEAASAHFEDLKAFSYRCLGVKRGALVLDVGCGIGQDACELRRLVGAAGRVVGIDYSEEMIAEARRRSEAASFRPEFLVGEAHRLNFHQDTFDACRADRVLQHLDDPRAALAEMVRVARPGGTVQIIDRDWGLVAVDADDQAVTRAVLDRICWKIRNRWIGRQLPALFRDCGLKRVRVSAVPITVRDFRLADTLLDLTQTAGHAVNEGLVSADGAGAWREELQQRSDTGRFFAAWVMFVATGKKNTTR